MDIFYFLVKIMALAIMFTNGRNSSKVCKKLSNECRIEEITLIYDIFVCNSLKKSFEMKVDEYIMCRKKNHKFGNHVNYMLSSPEILDNSHNLTSIGDFFQETKKKNNSFESNIITIKYSNLKGLDLNTSFSTNDSNLNRTNRAIIGFHFYLLNSKFQFFINNQLQVSCEDYLNWNLTQPNSLFQVKTNYMDFQNIKFSKTPICPLYFKNANIGSFELSIQLNTFYKRNYLSFSTFNNSDIDFLNANIETLRTKNEKFNIDSNSFLNKYVFKNIKTLYLGGVINSIEKDIFRSFKQITSIKFEKIFFGKLYRKGIEWISSINYDLNVNLSNKSELDLKVNQTKILILSDNLDIKIMIFQNEDFCLFKDFPFNQLIVFQIHGLKELMKPKYTCTLQWILQYYHLYVQYPNMPFKRESYSDYFTSNRENISNKFEKCDFEKIIDNCNRRKFQSRDNEWTINDTKEMIIFLEFILIILLPIICLLGLLSNIMIIYTLSIKDNKKDLKTVQYSYLKMVSVSNIIILIISILSPLFECQSNQKNQLSYGATNQELAIYCSPYHNLIVAQYYKIIFAEFLYSVFMLLSNFGYVGFSICRLSMIGKEQTKLTKWFSEIPILYYIIASTIISVGLSVIKLFKYEVNTSNPLKEYPNPIYKKYNYEILLYDYFLYLDYKKRVRLILIFYVVSDLISYFMFIPINFILDLVLILKMKKALSEKINMEVKKEKEILFRVKILALTFLLSNFLMKLPSIFKSIWDITNSFNSAFTLSHKIDKQYQEPNEKWYYFFFEKLATILFIISISGIILFYYLFDKNFKFGLKIAISKLTSSKKSHLEYVEALEKSRTKK